ncbi:MAG: hypothetical protein ACJ72V_17330, partial [Nitrososphaeraceae archaeon]
MTSTSSSVTKTTAAATAAATTKMSTAASSAADDDVTKTMIENATEGLFPRCFSYLFDRVLPASREGKENALTICDYMSSLRSEINPSYNYRRDTIILLCSLSTFFNNNAKPFKEITREDLLSFLDSYRKAESIDP